MSLWLPSSQGPGQLLQELVEGGGDEDQPSQHCSTQLESWEVPMDLTGIVPVKSVHNSWNVLLNPEVWFAGSSSKFSALSSSD